MPTSQFVQFSSSDVAGPGLLTGAAGTLLALLDACLVTGYAGHTLPAQWTKPMANSGNIGAYTQGAGAGLSLVINDNGPNVTSTYQEVWAIGWETVAGIGAPVGTGSGQFPTPAQLLTTGHTVWRKSKTADGATRSWRLFADSRTFYLFVFTGDTAGVFYMAGFGDIFSIEGSSDAYRCMIMGRLVENSATGGTTASDVTDCINFNNGGSPLSPILNTLSLGHYVARSYGGAGTSVVFVKLGDISKMTTSGSAPLPILGIVQTPNGPDNSLYLSPIVVAEPSANIIRGRLRGLYQVCHPIASFADGQTFSGGGDYAGKTFQLVLKGSGGGFFAVETSATVETN